MPLIRIFGLFVLSVLLFSVFNYSVVYSASNNKFVNVLIGFKGKPDESYVKAIGGTVEYNFHLANITAARVPEDAVYALARDQKVSYIEPDTEVRMMQDTSSVEPDQEVRISGHTS